MGANIIILVITLLIASSAGQGDQTTKSPTTPTSVAPKPEEKGLILAVYDDWGWTDNSAQLRHLYEFPGINGDVKNDSSRISFTNEDIQLLSIDYDYRHRTVYMYDHHYSIVIIGSNYSAAMNTSEMEFKVLHHVMSRGTVQVAYDWLSQTVYWCDPGLRMIVAASGEWGKIEEDRYKIIVSGHLEVPDGVALDPIEGYLFWSDNGKNPKIERAMLDGSVRHTIVTKNLKSPLTLEVDIPAKRLYWIDTYTESVLSTTYDGLDMQVITTISSALFFDLGIFRDVLYVCDIMGEDMFVLDKITGEKKANAVSYYEVSENIYAVAVYTDEVQPVKDTDYCAEKKCDHLCISLKNGAKCVCTEGYTLNPTTQKCDEDAGGYNKAFVYASESEICLVDIRSVKNIGTYPPKCVFTMIKQTPKTTTPNPARRRKRQATEAPTNAPTTKGTSTPKPPTPTPSQTTTTTTTAPPPTVAPEDKIKMIELDMHERFVFFVTQNDRIFRRSLNLTIEDDEKELLATGSATVTGLAYDPLDRNLYWSQANNMIYMVNIDSPVVEQLYPDYTPNKPKDLIVLIDQRKLAFIAGNDDDMMIQTMNFDGTGMETLVDELETISSLVFDRDTRKFYFLAEGRGRLNTYPLTGGDSQADSVTSLPDSATYILLEYHTYFIWVYKSASYPNLIMATQKSSPYTASSHNFFDNHTTIIDMKILDKEKLTTLPDLCHNNGGCEHACISKLINGKPSRVCQCKKGYQITNEVNCTSTPVNDNFCLICDWTNDEVLQIELGTKGLRAIPAQENYLYMGTYLDPDTLRMYWSEYYESYIYSSKLDGTDVRIEGDVYDAYPFMFAKDSSTGNMYYISYFYQHVGIVTPKGHVIQLTEDAYWEDYTAIAVHPGTGHMYIAVVDYGDAYIARYDMDGDNFERLMDGDLVRKPEGLAIDYAKDHLYVADSVLDIVQRCDLDGKNCEVIVNATDMEIKAITTDGEYLYYTSYKKSYIVRHDLVSPYNEIKMGQNEGLGKVNSISCYRSLHLNKQPVDQKNGCFQNNGLGDCSTACMPTPGGGRTCKCENGVTLEPDGRTCGNVHLCKDVIIRQDPASSETYEVTFRSDCLRRLNSTCRYLCPPNFMPVDQSRLTLTCNKDGWDRETSNLCEELRCPSTIDNGAVAANCSRNVGSVCDFSCNTGYVMSRTTIHCTEHGTWATPLGGNCMPYKCPDNIPNGVLDANCDRTVGSTCSFQCNNFYDYSLPAKSGMIQCGANGWNLDTSAICQAAKCDDSSLSNGMVDNNCDKKIGSRCNYTCDTSYTNSSIYVVCLSRDKVWHPDNACRKISCPMDIDRGYVDKECNREVNQECEYYCDSSSSYLNPKTNRKIKCLQDGNWNQSVGLCQEQKIIPEKQTDAQTGKQTGLLVGVILLALIIAAMIVVAVIFFKRRGKSSNFPTASYKNGTNIAIENPGYGETNLSNIEIKDDDPYNNVDVNQMQPSRSDDGIPNPLYSSEPLPEVGQVGLNQDKAVLTYDSWMKERELEKQKQQK